MIVLVVALIGVVIIVIICKRRQISRQKQDLTTTRYSTARPNTSRESVEFDPSQRRLRPSAPSEQPVMTVDTQLVAPPTYEESMYHPVAPSDY